MGNKYYGHTLSGVIDDIKIEPSARSYTNKLELHPVNTSGSINNSLPQASNNIKNYIDTINKNPPLNNEVKDSQILTPKPLGIVGDIEIEPSARSSTDKSVLHPVNASGSINDSLPQVSNNIKNYIDTINKNPPLNNGVKNSRILTPKPLNTSAKPFGSSLILKLRANIDLLKNEPVVAKLTGDEFSKSDKKLSQQVSEFFKSFGNKVTRKGFGDITIDNRGIKDSIAHGMGRNKAITFASVPDVIKDGKLIDYSQDWKGRNYDSYVLAAPVKIGENTNFVGVVIIRDKITNRYYLHEVITEKGDILSFKTGSLPKGGFPGDNVSSYTNIIPQVSNNIKNNIIQ